jgi:hypothetical protein
MRPADGMVTLVHACIHGGDDKNTPEKKTILHKHVSYHK